MFRLVFGEGIGGGGIMKVIEEIYLEPTRQVPVFRSLKIKKEHDLASIGLR
jgi:hypothetical protein